MRKRVKLKEVMRSLGITHGYRTYYMGKSPRYRIPEGVCFKKGRTVYVPAERIRDVVSALPARNEAGAAYKRAVVEGVVQPDLFEDGRTGTLERKCCGTCGGKKDHRVHDSGIRRVCVGMIRDTGKELGGSLECTLRGLWTECYTEFDTVLGKAMGRKMPVFSESMKTGENRLDVIERLGLLREFLNCCTAVCTKHLSR